MSKIFVVYKDYVKKILILSFLCGLLVAYFFVVKNNKPKVADALALFNNSDYVSTQGVIEEIAAKNKSFHSDAYKGFVALAQKDIKIADQYFQRSFYFFNKDEEMHQILLGKALCSFYLNRIEEMGEFLNLAQKISSRCPHFLLLKSLYDYKKEDYAQFLIHVPHERGKTKSWMHHILENQFPSSFLEVLMAHALIEEGDFFSARSLLEKYIDLSHDSHKEAAFYLAYSYLKESVSMEGESRDSFFKIALFYLERSGRMTDKDPLLASFFIKEFLKSLHSNAYHYLAFLEFLEKNQAHDLIASSFNEMIEGLKKEKWDLCHLLKFEQLCVNKNFHSVFIDKLLLAFEKSVQEKKDNFLLHWNGIEDYVAFLDAKSVKKIKKIIINTINNSLLLENNELKTTHLYLNFFKKLHPSDEEKNELAEIAFYQGVNFWRVKNGEIKAITLFTLALEMADDKAFPYFQKNIHDFLINLYLEAQEDNSVERLALLFDALKVFNIDLQNIVTKTELANHVADAAYFFSQQNYFSAKMHANWAMKLDPSNEEAIRFVGLSAFHLGHYSDAIECLQKLRSYDLEVIEALALCESYFSDEALAQVNLNCLEIHCHE